MYLKGKIRFGLAQMVSRPHKVGTNLDTMLEMIEQARKEGCEHVVFPELAMSGYVVDGEFSNCALTVDSEPIQRLRKASQGLAITFGFIEETASAIFHNSALHIRDGEFVHLHRKIYLPTYGMFDERRYYGPGWDVSAFDTIGGRMAILVCGDAWHLSLPYLAVHDGADILLVIAASSYEGLAGTTRSDDAWRSMCRSYALTLTSYVVFVNHAMIPNSEGFRFWGGSFLTNPDGTIGSKCVENEQQLLVAEIDMGQLRDQRIRLPFRRDDSLSHTLELGGRILSRKVERSTVDGLGKGSSPVSRRSPAKPR